MVSSLAFTERDVDRFLEEKTGISFVDVTPPSRRRFSRRPSKNRWGKALIGPGSAEPVDADKRRDAYLARQVLSDLDVVAKTRLLGRDQELYSEVDRARAEVEFRLAVIPPLLVLAIAVGARSNLLLLPLWALLGAVLAWGLFTDGVRSEKVTNQILLQSIADRRVDSPTLERLETEAAAEASRQNPDLMRIAAKDAVVALQDTVVSLEHVERSEPSLANYARRKIDVAHESITRMSRLFPPAVAQTAQEALRLLTVAADAWVAMIKGRGIDLDKVREHLDNARKLIADFQTQARQAMESVRASASPQPGRSEADP